MPPLWGLLSCWADPVSKLCHLEVGAVLSVAPVVTADLCCHYGVQLKVWAEGSGVRLRSQELWCWLAPNLRLEGHL